MPFKNKTKEELLSIEEVESLPDYAGIIQDGYILVDVDDEVQSKVLLDVIKEKELDTLVYKTTRGIHTYWKVNSKCLTNKTNTFTAMGLKVDMKLGSRNSYACMKHEGILREKIYESDNGVGELPMFLSPVNYTFPFLEMESGDGRNSSLFSYILTLQSNGFDKGEIKDTIRLINDYVLEDGLDESEIEVILRDDAFSEDNFYGGESGNQFLIDKFANFMISEHNILKLDGELHIYDDGVYVAGNKRIERLMVSHIPMMRSTERSEVLKYIDILIIEDSVKSSPDLIPFRNGVYDVRDGSFIEFSEDYILTNKIDWNYNPGAYSKVADEMLNKLACNDSDIRSLLDEIIGYTFYRSNLLRKCFILTGDKRNGKSTYLEMLENILGRENRSALDMGELGERFKTAQLGTVLANIGDDINDGFIRDASTFKKLVSGDTVNVERKGLDPFDMENYSKLMFSANSIPRIKDDTGAVIDRIITVPFNNTFSSTDEDFNPNIRAELKATEVMEYGIIIGLKALREILDRKGFTESDKSTAKLDEYELENNPIKLFVHESDIQDIVNESTSQVYLNYQGFCVANGMHPLGRIVFVRNLCSELGLKNKQIQVGDSRLMCFIEG